MTTPSTANDELDEILYNVWCSALDASVMHNVEMADEPVEVAEAAYLKYQKNILTKAKQAIAAYVAQAERKARLTELKMLQDLYKNELKFTHRDETELRSYTQYRISELERQSDEG